MNTLELSVVSIVSWFSAVAMIFGGVFPYIPQYREIKKSGNADGFSLYVCLALLSANILRILFWFGKPFETPLLIQSVLMNLAMLLMVHLCVNVKSRSEIIKKKDNIFTGSSDSDGSRLETRTFRDFDRNHFWDWTDFRSYIECILVFTTAGAVAMFMFSSSSLFVETVGFMAVFVEAMLGLPQFLKNYRNKSTRGMNRSMVLMWTCGDVFKTTYFVMRAAPIQFSICGALQIGVDLAILTQIWFYTNNGSQLK